MAERVQCQFELRVGQRCASASVWIPTGPLRPFEILPLFLALGDAYMAMVREQVEEAGAPVSCRAGCGACCRQIVPVSETEAYYLARLVASMPEPDRARVLRRFKQAIARLDENGLLEPLCRQPVPDFQKRSADYWALALDCPFLEDGSCGIYPHRPMACREYLVTSPAANCASPSRETIRTVMLPAKISNILLRFADGRGGAELRVLPLILALEWAAQHDPASQPALPGPELFRNFLAQIAPLPQAD